MTLETRFKVESDFDLAQRRARAAHWRSLLRKRPDALPSLATELGTHLKKSIIVIPAVEPGSSVIGIAQSANRAKLHAATQHGDAITTAAVAPGRSRLSAPLRPG